MTQSSEDQVNIEIPLDWGTPDVPARPANQFLLQGDGHEFFLTVGHTVPPAIIGRTPAEQRELLARSGPVKVDVAARFVLAPTRLRELARLLANAAQQLERGAS